MQMQRTVVTVPDKEAVAAVAAARLVGSLAELLASREVVHLCLTGGSLGSAIWEAVQAVPGHTALDWSRVNCWWGDERYLPAGAADRNDTQNIAAGLYSIGIPDANMHRVAGPDASADAEASAAAYGEALRATGTGAFDITLLGMGPDGHVASLFPHHPAQRTTDAIAVAVHDSPKPPPTRVSLTFECLARSNEVWFLVAGGDKADAVCRALSEGTDRWDVPAAGVSRQAQTIWFVDEAAAGQL